MCLTPKPGSNENDGNNDSNHHNHNHNYHANANANANGFAIGISELPPQQNGVHGVAMEEFPTSPTSPSMNGNAYNYNNARRLSVNPSSKQSAVIKAPHYSVLPENVVFNPSKPASKQSIFERWMIAQLERQSGQQPTICHDNNVILTNLHRVRAPTTFHTLQQKINRNTAVLEAPHNLDAGDWTDDEDEEIPPNSPRSYTGSATYTPSASDNEDELNGGSFSTQMNAIQGGYGRSQTFQRNAMAKHVQAVSEDTDYQYSAAPPMQPQAQQQQPAKSHLGRTYSTDDARSLLYKQKKLLNQRRRKKTNRKQQSVSQLWFKAQAQLQQGKNPTLLAKYNIKLQNIRQHNPRFKDFERRKSHYEKAATYLQVTGHKLNAAARNLIAIDQYEDEDEESETENDLSGSAPPTPNTPISMNDFGTQFNGDFVEWMSVTECAEWVSDDRYRWYTYVCI